MVRKSVRRAKIIKQWWRHDCCCHGGTGAAPSDALRERQGGAESMPDQLDSAEYETVKDLANYVPYVGQAVALITAFYDFGKTNPIEVALRDLRDKIDLLSQQMQVLRERVDKIEIEIVKLQNMARVRTLQEQTLEIDALAFRLLESPGDQAVAREVAFEAGARADVFLSDTDLWLWSDIRKTATNDEAVEADFKTLPALGVYATVISTWIAAVLVASGEDITVVQRDYGTRLRRHIEAVSVRSGWDDLNDLPMTFPEQIRSRITCSPVASTKFAQNGVCKYVIQCLNVIERTNTGVRDIDMEMDDPGPTVLCTADPNLGLPDERSIEEEDYGIVILRLLEQMLRDIDRNGTLRQQFIGQFDFTKLVFATAYAAQSDGSLSWFHQIQPSADGKWTGPLLAGNGLTGLRALLSGGGDVLYGVSSDGTWAWYRHRASGNTTISLTGPNALVTPTISAVFDDQAQIFAGGDGVFYALRGGVLHWTRDQKFQSGGGSFSEPRAIRTDWGPFTHLFSTGFGTIYAVSPDGVLRWFRHTEFLTGTGELSGGTQIGTGWTVFSRIFSVGDGLIYGVYPNGSMLGWYHVDWENGAPDWQGPLSVSGTTWNQYSHLLGMLPAPLTGIN
jgi:Tachylectin